MIFNTTQTKVITNIVIMTLMIIFISLFGLELTIPYPKIVVTMFDEPLARILLYFAAYILAEYNPIISLLYLMLLIFVHVDYINII
jgi:hypothetical protein